MTEHVCVVCPTLRPNAEPRIYERANVDEGCRARLQSLVGELSGYYGYVDLRRPSNGSQRVSGSRTPPLPLRVEALDLRLHPHVHPVHDPYGDQIGHPGVATILDSWARDWQTYLDVSLPSPTVTLLCGWLLRWLDKACDTHPAIDEFAAEILDLVRTLRRAIGVAGPAVELLDVPCRKCEWLSLAPIPRQDRIECLNCGDLSTGDEYTRWTGLLAAGVQQCVVDFDLDARLYVDEAALLVRVSQAVIRQWSSRGLLTPVSRDHGRPRFTARDIFEAERRTRSGVLAV